MSDKSDSSDSSSRISRKIGEKNRRDRLNTLITKLAEENPWSATSEKRVDKAGILKLTVCYLKFHHGIKKLKISERTGLSHLSTQSVQTCIEEALNGFLLIISEKEKVVFVSSSVTKILGLHQVDVIGADISKFVHPDDTEAFRKQLSWTSAESTSNGLLSKQDDSEDKESCSTGNKKRSFYIRILRETDDRNGSEKQYEMVHFNGKLRINRKKGRPDTLDNRWLIVVGRPLRSEMINEIPTLNSKDNEFVTQFDLHGNITYNDHRSALLLCQLPNESIGRSCYTTVHEEDLLFVSNAHTQIMNSSVTTTVFRLQIPVMNNICRYVISRSAVARDRWTNKPKYIVSLTIVLSDEEGERLLKEQRQALEDSLGYTCNSKLNCETIDVRLGDQKLNDINLEEDDEVFGIDPRCETDSSYDDVNIVSTPGNEVSALKRQSSTDEGEENDTSFHKLDVLPHSTNKKSVLKEKLNCESEVCVKSRLTSILNSMDASQSRYGRYHAQKLECSNNPELAYKSPYLYRDTNIVFGSNSVSNNHVQNNSSFHPYHRNYMSTKTVHPSSTDFTPCSQSSVQQHHFSMVDSSGVGQSRLPLPPAHSYYDNLGQAAGFSTFNSTNGVYSSNVNPFLSSHRSLHPQNYPIESLPVYNRPLSTLISDSSNTPCVNQQRSSIRAHKTTGTYPYYGANSVIQQPCSSLPGYETFDRESGSSSLPDNQSVSNNGSEDSFDSFSYDSNIFNNQSIPVSDYLKDVPISFDGNHVKGLLSDGLKYTALEVGQNRNYLHTGNNVSGKDTSHEECQPDSAHQELLSKKTKVQSPTVDSVTSPSLQKVDEKELQIQLKLSQQLQSKQNLIGNNLTNQRKELGMLKSNLDGKGSVNSQYIALLQRLNNLEKEVEEQDTILTDLREQSSFKTKQLMSLES